MNDGVMLEAAKQAPALVVLVILVLLFLRSQKDRDQMMREALTEGRAAFTKALEDRDRATLVMSGQVATVAASATEALRENTKALGKIEECLDETRAVMVSCEKR